MRKLLSSWWVVSALAALLVALLLAAGLPLVVGALRPIGVRLACVAVVAGGWGFLAFLRARHARSAADAIAAELARSRAGTGPDDDTDILAARMTDALATLKGESGGRRDYLYAKPWYVIIGPPGAGKTTALLNSGLRFPVGDQALKGVGGTRNLDFWFADEAAMVDTAGRYTTQDSDAAADAKEWTDFLGLLKKHRPRQPINGVIVAIGIDELLRSGGGEIDRHARAVRQRLAELRGTLEVAAPVYVILTKADLLAGFAEYYDDLDVEGRRAVLGATFPWSGGTPSPEAVAAAFDELVQSIADRQARRLTEEGDMQRRSLLLGFPSQMEALRPHVLRFVDGAFGGGESGGVLRGVYLTSGVQEGTPLDRLLSGMAEVYDRPQRAPGGSQGRAYFLNRLLTEVMFPEAGLVTIDERASAQQRHRLVASFAGLAVVAILALGAWGASFAKNRAFQRAIVADTGQAQQAIKAADIDLKEVRVSDPDLRAALPVLYALRDLPRGYPDQQRGAPPIAMTFGLYQSGLSGQAEASYREALRRIMLPRLLLRLEQVMQGVPARAHRALDVYLMLGGRRRLDKAAVASFVTADWASDVYPGARNAALRSDLAAHLAVLLDDPDLASVWPRRRAPLNGPLVAQVTSNAVAAAPVAPPPAATPLPAASGPLAPFYAANVLPVCRNVAQGHYPFFGTAPQDAAIADAQHLFGTGGVMEGFILQRAMPAMDTAGPIWRWRSDSPAAAALDPQSPEEFSKAMQIRDLLTTGLPLKISVAALGADVTGAAITASGTTDAFSRSGNETKPLTWTATGAPGAEVVLRGAGDAELARIKADGPWALFRLMDQATRENAGPRSFKATFGDGAKSVTFLVELPSERNPFSRGGVWSFRCPTAL